MKLGIVVLDLNGGDFTFHFVDEDRWSAILAVPEEDNDLEGWQESVLALVDPDNPDAGPGTMVRTLHSQRNVVELGPVECSGIIGILTLELW